MPKAPPSNPSAPAKLAMARVAGVHGCVFEASHGLVAGLNDGLQGFPFVLHVALDRFNRVGNQVVSPLQLDLDLREGVLKTVLQSDELVVNADEGHDQEQEENADDDKNDDGSHDD